MTEASRIIVDDPPSPEQYLDRDRPSVENPDGGWEWAIVEIFGHRRHAGRCREEERFGAKMLRVDVPLKGDSAVNGWETHWYGGGSIFSYTLADEADVMRINKPYDAPSRYRLPPPDPDDSEADIQADLQDEELPF